MTKQEVIDYIAIQLQTPVTLVSKFINSFSKVLDFVSESSVDEVIPDWNAALTFQTDGTDAGKYCLHPDANGKKRIFETKVDDNTNNAPPTDPDVPENASWEEISQSSGSALKEYAPGLYGSGLVIVYHNHSLDGNGLYKLVEPARPFNSTDIEAEISAGKWAKIGGSGKGIAKAYATVAALLADQGAQQTDFFYFVTDASTDVTVDAGWAIYQKLSATTGEIGDYRKLSEQESLDVVLNISDASDTVAGKVERATIDEVRAGTSTGGTGAPLFVSPPELSEYVNESNYISAF